MEVQMTFTIGEGIESAKSKKIEGVTKIVLMGDEKPIIIYKFDDVQHPNMVGSTIAPAVGTPESQEEFKHALEEEQIAVMRNLLETLENRIRLDRQSRELARTQNIETLQRQEERRQRNTLDRVFQNPPEGN